MNKTTMLEKRVLVVDDEEMIRSVFSKGLGHAGFKVKTAVSAEEALAIMKEEPYSLLFLDLHLPDGMDGIALCREIRKQWPMSITVAVTGYASYYELSDCRHAGFEDYFTKPVVLSDLIKVANDAFEKLERWKRK